MKNITLLFFLLLLSLESYSKTIWLDELNTEYMLQDWGGSNANNSVLWTPMQVAGVKYERGIGTHSISRFLLNLDNKAVSFSGFVGADDRNDFCTKMEFKLIADQKEIWSSGIMTKGMAAKEFKVNLKGVKKLLLLVTEGGDGIMYDHANWMNAKFETKGEIIPEPIFPKNIQSEKYILTPTPKDTPQINGAKVFGVRPGSPFLYQIAATGARPMNFSVKYLPEGLSVDKETGLITGRISTKGTYNVILEAENNLGATSRVLRIEVGDQICLTPPMGWNSFNCWGLDVDEKKVKDAADLMECELIYHGWNYINIDDAWQASQRETDGELLGNERFPDIKGLSNYIHSKGLKFGIYSSPGPKSCGDYPGSYQYEQQDANTWANWGVDYLKYDYCSYSVVAPSSSEKDIQKPYIVMKDALNRINRDIVYCVGFGAPNVWNWGAEAGGNQWRTTRDIADRWNIVLAIGTFQDVCASATKPGNYNDPDMLVVGKIGKGWGQEVHDSYLSADEQYSHVSLWSLLSAPLLIGCDMASIDDFTRNLLTNDEVLSINQDPLVMPAHKIIKDNGQIWYKYLEDGSMAVGFFNIDPYFVLWDKSEAETIQHKRYDISIALADIGLKGKFKVRDVWRQKDLGIVEGSYSASVPYHGVQLVKFIPVK